MRKVERPPFKTASWDMNKVIESTIFLAKLNQIAEIDDSTYPYWEKWKYIAKDWKRDPKKLWWMVKDLRMPYKQISFNDHDKFQMIISSPSVMQQQLHELDLNLGGSLNTSGLIPSEEKQRYLVSSLMEEAIASSQLEGAATTRKLAKEMLQNNRKPRNHSEQMIVNNYEAMQWIVENKTNTLGLDDILQLHRIITNKTLQSGEEEGAFRNDDEVKVVDLDMLMNEFCIFANDRRKEKFFLHPITKAIILHFLLGYIHPFADGNGRTARAIFYWYLIKNGYWLIEYMSVSRVILASKAQYARAYQYTEFDGNDLTYFVLYNLKAMRTSLEDLKKYIERKNREKSEILNLLRNTDYNDRQIIILQEILNNKKIIYTVNEIENRFGISNQTARNDLNFLVTKGILAPRTSGRKIQFLSTGEAARIVKSH